MVAVFFWFKGFISCIVPSSFSVILNAPFLLVNSRYWHISDQKPSISVWACAFEDSITLTYIFVFDLVHQSLIYGDSTLSVLKNDRITSASSILWLYMSGIPNNSINGSEWILSPSACALIAVRKQSYDEWSHVLIPSNMKCFGRVFPRKKLSSWNFYGIRIYCLRWRLHNESFDYWLDYWLENDISRSFEKLSTGKQLKARSSK